MFWCVLANGVDNLQQDHYCWWASSSGYKRVDTCSLCSRVYWPSAWHTPGTSLLVLGSDHHVLIQVQGWRAAADAGSKCQDLVSLWPNCWNLFWNMNMSAPVSVAMSEVSTGVCHCVYKMSSHDDQYGPVSKKIFLLIYMKIISVSGYPHNPYNGVICNDVIAASGVFTTKELWKYSKGEKRKIAAVIWSIKPKSCL